jgi:hypothetical protein
MEISVRAFTGPASHAITPPARSFKAFHACVTNPFAPRTLPHISTREPVTLTLQQRRNLQNLGE